MSLDYEAQQYFIQSPWDGHWINANDELTQLVQHLEPESGDETYAMYNLNYAGKNYTVLKSTPGQVGFRNRVMDCFSYRVEVFINNQYVRARPHQEQALIKYVVTNDSNVEVPHPHGGMFRVTFSTIDDNNYQYITEDNNVVKMRRVMIF